MFEIPKDSKFLKYTVPFIFIFILILIAPSLASNNFAFLKIALVVCAALYLLRLLSKIVFPLWTSSGSVLQKKYNFPTKFNKFTYFALLFNAFTFSLFILQYFAFALLGPVGFLVNMLASLVSVINIFFIFVLLILVLVFWKKEKVHVWPLVPFLFSIVSAIASMVFNFYANTQDAYTFATQGEIGIEIGGFVFGVIALMGWIRNFKSVPNSDFDQFEKRAFIKKSIVLIVLGICIFFGLNYFDQIVKASKTIIKKLNPSSVQEEAQAGKFVHFGDGLFYFANTAGKDFIWSTGSNGKVYFAHDGIESQVTGLNTPILNATFIAHDNNPYVVIYHTEEAEKSWNCCSVYKINGNTATILNQGEYPYEVSYDSFFNASTTKLVIRGKNELSIIKNNSVTPVVGLPSFDSAEGFVSDIYSNWYAPVYAQNKAALYYLDNGVATLMSKFNKRFDVVKSAEKIYIYSSDDKNGYIYSCDKAVCTLLQNGTLANNSSFRWIETGDSLYALGNNGIYSVENNVVTLLDFSFGNMAEIEIEKANSRAFVVKHSSLGSNSRESKIFEIKNNKIVPLGDFSYTYARFRGNSITGKIYVRGLNDMGAGNYALYELGGNGLTEIKLEGKHLDPSEVFFDKKGNDYVTRYEDGEASYYLIKDGKVHRIENSGTPVSGQGLLSNDGGSYVQTETSLYKINLGSSTIQLSF